MTLVDVRRIAAESLCDYRTVMRAYEGEPIWQVTRERIRRAAEKLNLEPPPPPVFGRRCAS
jgi:DNA-binding LacI/PurR family transcriptional regulator